MCRTHWRSRHVSSLTPTHCLRMGRWLWAPAPSLRTGSGLRMSSVRVGRTGEQCRWSVCTHPRSHPCNCINPHVTFQTPPICTHISTDSQSHTYLRMQNRCVIVWEHHCKRAAYKNRDSCPCVHTQRETMRTQFHTHVHNACTHLHAHSVWGGSCLCPTFIHLCIYVILPHDCLMLNHVSSNMKKAWTSSAMLFIHDVVVCKP